MCLLKHCWGCLVSIWAVWSCFVPHFGSLGIPFGYILTVWSGHGPHVGGLGRYPGHGIQPELTQRRQNGLDCIHARAGALFYAEPGIRAQPKWKVI